MSAGLYPDSGEQPMSRCDFRGWMTVMKLCQWMIYSRTRTSAR